MPEPQRRLILANGEKYVQEATKKNSGRQPEMPRTYAQARDAVRNEVKVALEKIAALPKNKRREDEAIMCLRLHPDMMAKTYDPKGIFTLVRELENVGSRNYHVATRQVTQTMRIKKQLEKHILEVTGRIVFVRSNDSGFRRFLSALDAPERTLPAIFREDIQRIEKFDILNSNEQFLGFDSNWKEGRVEIILHPSSCSEDEQANFIKELFNDDKAVWKKSRIATYPDGPTFISCRLTRAALNSIAGANPLRAAHPLVFGGFENLRSAPTFPAPPPPNTETRSTIKIGMFDGGIDTNHPLLKGHSEQDDGLSITNPSNADCIAHGTAVAGTILHGPLNGHDSKMPLPQPPVSIVSFRALPTSNPLDIDLYESIDVIESAVPARPDIKFFNVSFGPRGPILDDTISRFTYALDSLAATHKSTFCVAVGNDGEAGDGMDRIQSPSDLVNGFGVGAYTSRNGKNVHAPYSCKGPGRECGKIKPDVSAFGGCDQQPIHLLSSTPGLKLLSHGTSFASPIVASLGGQAAASFERGTALLARALLIHTAQNPAGQPDHLLGHGLVRSSLDDMLRCKDREVTIIYQGDILPKKMVRLPILLPLGLNLQGNIAVTWTIAALPIVSPNHPSDYTSCCIEDTFYPNDQVFNFTTIDKSGKQKTKRHHLITDASEIADLLAHGWKKSSFPATESGNKYPTELERRSLDYKWETIIRHQVSKRSLSLHEPFLVLHAIPRNGAIARMDYAAIVTISAPKFTGDLYDAVLRRFTALQPIRLRSQAELRVQIDL
jgi:hypothetical protein